VGGFLIVPALAYISRESYSANISPMTPVMRLFTGDTISMPEILLPVVFVLIMSVITFWIAAYLFKRDDILFGPRPGPVSLLLQLIGIKK
jgi:ABC-2 type transport system permease protein